MSRRLEGKVAIITGAGTGIGEAIAHKFAKEGANVVVNGLEDDPIFDVAESYPTCSHGNIVAAGSKADFNGVPHNSPYSGTKGWMHAFIKGVAVEQAKYGVRANCFCPGAIDTA